MRETCEECGKRTAKYTCGKCPIVLPLLVCDKCKEKFIARVPGIKEVMEKIKGDA